MDHLRNKIYVNEVSLIEQNLSSKCCQSLESKLCKESAQDCSKVVLWVSVGEKAAKLKAVKVGGLKKILLLGLAAF